MFRRNARKSWHFLKTVTSKMVCVLCGTRTHSAKGVSIEYSIAKQLGKPLFLLKGYRDVDCTRPKGAENEKMYSWTWESLKTLIHGGR